MKLLARLVAALLPPQLSMLGYKAGISRRQISLVISTTQSTLYNVFTAAGSPTDVVDVVLSFAGPFSIDAGLTTTNSFAPGSSFEIINTGTIQGAGGSGGDGDAVTGAGAHSGAVAGLAGGDAIITYLPTRITNGSGFIRGGGGGGGGGGMGSTSTSGGWNTANAAGGGGGGGGVGVNNAVAGAGGTVIGNGSGSAGDQGTAGGPGNGGANASCFTGAFSGAGGRGGDWGQAGSTGDSGTGSGAAGGAAGGAGGYAVRSPNSSPITWVSGNDATHVKGTVA